MRESSNGPTDEYTGYKWGIFLRAPEIFFKLLRRGGKRFGPLGQIAEVRFEVKSDCDRFFFPQDVTSKAINDLTRKEFKERYGIRPSETDGLSDVLAGDKTSPVIEKEFPEPIIFSSMELNSRVVDVNSWGRKIFLVSLPKEELKNTYALKYI